MGLGLEHIFLGEHSSIPSSTINTGHRNKYFLIYTEITIDDNLSSPAYMCVLYVAAEQRAMAYYATVSVCLMSGRLSGSLDQSLRKLQCQAAFSSGHLSGEESASKLIQVE